MANTKISALPASTTPLAGTEVLPIVQSSTTKQVSVANLTAGRAVATGALTVTGAATVSTTLGVTGATTLSSVATTTGTISTTPSGSTDIANKAYVDTVAQGLDTKASVVAGTTANITLSGTQTIDGVVLIAGDRVLVKNQTTTANNGLYLCASGFWSRTTDMDTWAEVPGAYVFVEGGSTLADTGWVCTSDAGGTINVTAITWAQFSGASSGVSSINFGSTGLTPSSVTTGAITVAGTLAVASGGTGTATPNIVAGTNITVTGTWPNQTITASGGSGSVTSVAASVPSVFSIAGSPITTSGTLAITYSGTALPVANGGTGITTTPTNGQIPIGNGTNYTAATLTAGTGITVTNASGSITIASTGGGSTSIGLVRAIAVNCILC